MEPSNRVQDLAALGLAEQPDKRGVLAKIAPTAVVCRYRLADLCQRQREDLVPELGIAWVDPAFVSPSLDLALRFVDSGTAQAGANARW
ncbi:MAG: hypothetical protein ACM3N0_01720 [Chloroflexota bacterium]